MAGTEVTTQSPLQRLPVESPFTWGLAGLLVKESSNIMERLLEKEHVVEEQNAQFKWSSLMIQLLLSYELFNAGNGTEALRRADRCEAELARLDAADCAERFYVNMRRPLWHVAQATRALLIAGIGHFPVTIEYLDQEMDGRFNLTLFSNVELAGLFGIKAVCFLQYGYNGNMAALHWARRALAADPDEAEWHFLTGKTMGRVRRCTKKFSGVPREEVELIEKAVALNPNPKYIMYVAQVYQQSASAAFTHHRQDRGFYQSTLYKAINNMNQKAVELYRQALVFRSDCCYTHIRCLNGMLKLPRKYLDIGRLHQIIEKIMSISPNNTMFLHTVGVFYLKMEFNPQKALKYFEQASEQGNYGASMDAIRLRYRMNNQYNPVGRLRKLIQKFNARPHYQDAVTQLGSFFLFVARDVERAIRTYNTILAKEPECRAMEVHKPIFVRMTRPVNLYELLVNEVRVYELKGRPLDADVKENFMSLVARFYPALLDMEVDTSKIHSLVVESRRMDNAEKRRRSFLRKHKEPGGKSKEKKRIKY